MVWEELKACTWVTKPSGKGRLYLLAPTTKQGKFLNEWDEDGVEKNEIEQIWGSVDNINTFTNVTLSEKGSNQYEEIYTINVLNLSQSQK